MICLKLSLILLAVCLCSVYAETFSYENYKLIRIKPTSKLHLETIAQWSDNTDFDLWGQLKAVASPVLALLSPDAFNKYNSLMMLFNIEFEIVSNNAQEMLKEQEESMEKTAKSDSIVGRFVRFDKIQDFLKQTENNNKDIASSYVAGKTAENRDLKVLVLKTSTSKRNVWIDCGIHAREWISPATCVWIINNLINEHKTNPSTSLLNYFEFHILPVLNPDGYEYSHTTYRMWRKNRSKSSISSCVGTDLNRNWGFQWMTGGSSSNPCSDVYAGRVANSELETQAVQNAIMKYQGRWDSYITIHTFGLWWFTTYGYTTNLPANYNEVKAKAQFGVTAIKNTYGLEFELDSSARILYVASGGSEDWAYGVAKIPYSYCLELRPGQYGTDSNYGFILPEDRAPKAGEETYRGIKAFLNSIKK